MESSYEITARTREVLKKLNGGCSNWQEVELARFMETLLLQTEKIDRYKAIIEEMDD